jgi:hypothetical protein
LNSSAAAGVEIIIVEGIASPLIAIANEIGATVPPVGIAIFAPNETRNLARH